MAVKEFIEGKKYRCVDVEGYLSGAFLNSE